MRSTDDELVARPRRRRVPHGRHQPHLEGHRPSGRRTRARRSLWRRLPVLRAGAAHPRVPARDAPARLRRPRRRLPDRRRDAGRDRRRCAAVHGPRRGRGRHGLPVRARRARPRAGRQVGSRSVATIAGPEGVVRALAGRSGRRRAGTACTGTTTTSRASSAGSATTASTGTSRRRRWRRCCTCSAARRTSTRARNSA